ncbi:MAG: HIT family protein [Oscillospiraceae bacterium]|nr:HIT family protein [Oscillospiraceae bacterium]
MPCLICDRIAMIRAGTNPHFVAELDTGYVVLGDHQRFCGYTLFLCKQHANELHELEHNFKLRFLEEMSLVAEAVYHAFAPNKLNVELLGNGDTHLHWHIFPRRAGDTPQPGPVWWLPWEEMCAESTKPSDAERGDMIARLKHELEKLR